MLKAVAAMTIPAKMTKTIQQAAAMMMPGMIQMTTIPMIPGMTRQTMRTMTMALTVLANGCYRRLAHGLKGFDRSAPKQVYRKFVETAGEIEVQAKPIVVHFDRRCHNPILREAKLDEQSPPIPWLNNLPIRFNYK